MFLVDRFSLFLRFFLLKYTLMTLLWKSVCLLDLFVHEWAVGVDRLFRLDVT